MENKETTFIQNASGRENFDNGKVENPTDSKSEAPKSVPQRHGWNTRENLPQKTEKKQGTGPGEPETSQKS